MALNKTKLADISYFGFDVENIEVIERQLRECVNFLHKKNYRAAGVTMAAVEARAKAITEQCFRADRRAVR